MNNAVIFCLCLNNNLINIVKQLDYVPVGLGKGDFSKEWLRDFTGKNISQKNMYYGEHSFHYWLWKNYLENIQENKWIGFCAYRRFWQKDKQKMNTISNFRNFFLNKIPKEWEDYDVILGDKTH